MPNLTITMGEIMQYGSYVMLLVVAIATATDIIVQVMKGVLKNISTNVLVFIVSIVVSLLVLAIASATGVLTFAWWWVVVAVFVGFVAAFVGMYGYDKLLQTIEQLKKSAGDLTE